MIVTFCKSWFRARKCPTEIWDSKKAMRCHKSGSLYTVLLGNPEKPSCFIDVHLGVNFVGVHFLDSELRDYLTYKFEGTGDEKIFLAEAVYKEFEETTETILKITNYNFFQNGNLIIEERDFVDEETITKEALKPIDVTNNWESIPTFGDYLKIATLERPLNL